jgi:peroxiredoxin
MMTASTIAPRFNMRCKLPPILTSALLALMFASVVHAKNASKVTLYDLDGNRTSLSDFRGRVVVVNFWATWCLPCREELPRFSAMAQQYASSNVPFVLISIDDPGDKQKIRNFVAQHQLTLPVWVGGSAEMVQHFSQKGIVPATLVVDEHGEIIRIINGEARDKDVEEVVDWLLSGRKGPKPEAVVKRY